MSKQSIAPRREKRIQKSQMVDDATLLRQQIDSISAQAPRYLFRIWSSQSGGNARFNSTERIIPHAFLENDSDARSMIHHLGRTQIAYLANGHLRSGHVPTVFSSWTQSLPQLLSWARSGGHRYGRYIAVIDTTMLDPCNVVLYTPLMKTISNTIVEFPYEYLIYGVVEGPGYKAIPFEEFAEFIKVNRASDRSDTNYPHQREGLSELVDKASQLAKLYGKTFEAAIMSHLLTMQPASRATTSMLASNIAQLRLPEDWLREADPLRSGANVGTYPEAVRALDMMQRVIEVAKGEKTVAARESAASETRTAAALDEICAQKASQQKVGGEEADLARNRQAQARMKRMARQLYIDMIGWRPHELV
ncbi:hypothetical protein Tdes44962_MAKER00377 [Teratosphaeria destructans]|uniref:DUF7587 domain-containing protein n=1 Tax=Teratosphaeria destructans TaxID=418781 RepID=A0A9W7SS69_9PEZI|nr:hypothetical protein Tdes44962_MAKER00377 [Teratosphaeria destructans]